MKIVRIWFGLLLCTNFAVATSLAQAPAKACPVVISQIALSYSHAGTPSTPQLKVMFHNKTSREISAVTFALSILDSNGSPHSYPEELKYSERLQAGKPKTFTWDLVPESVDIHRAGEMVVVQKVEFATDASWEDDGSESCAMTVDYHGK